MQPWWAALGCCWDVVVSGFLSEGSHRRRRHIVRVERLYVVKCRKVEVLMCSHLCCVHSPAVTHHFGNTTQWSSHCVGRRWPTLVFAHVFSGSCRLTKVKAFPLRRISGFLQVVVFTCEGREIFLHSPCEGAGDCWFDISYCRRSRLSEGVVLAGRM